MLRSRLVFGRLANFVLSEIAADIPPGQKIHQMAESFTDLTHQLV